MTGLGIGTRELRAELATHVRRAASGERMVITVGGRPAALLGPISEQAASLESLVAVGALLPPRRDGPSGELAGVAVWTGVRLDQAFREVRG